MKNLINARTNQKGFTLVEVIVVAVIVAVLAAIAIPLYTGYVSTSRQSIANNAAGSLASFCAASRNSGVMPAVVGALVNGANNTIWNVPSKLTIAINGNLTNGGTVTVTSVDDGTITSTYSW
jgi:type IV pilus assembly protein PilA